MAIIVKCEHCKEVLKISDAAAGKRGKCPHCKGKINVPDIAPGPTGLVKANRPPDAGTPKREPAPQPAPSEPSPGQTVRCTNCGNDLANDAEVAGQIVECPHCNSRLQMPPLAGQYPLPVASPAFPLAAPAGQMVVAPTATAEKECPMCGETIKANAKRCKHCGEALDLVLAKVENAALGASGKGGGININVVNQGLAQSAGPPGAGLAITGMVLGIVGCPFAPFFCTFWLALILATLGLIFSSIGLAKSRASGQGKGMAIAGLSISLVTLLAVPISLCVMPMILLSIAGGTVATGVAGAQQQQAIIMQQKGTLQLRFAPGQRFEGMEIFVDNVRMATPMVIGNIGTITVDKGQRTVAVRVFGQEQKKTLNVNQATMGPTPFDVPIMKAK